MKSSTCKDNYFRPAFALHLKNKTEKLPVTIKIGKGRTNKQQKRKSVKVNDYQIHEMLPLGLGRGFPGGSDSEGSACNAGDQRSVPGSGRSPGEGNGNPRKEIKSVHPKENQS